MDQSLYIEECRYCGHHGEQEVVLRPDTQHHAEVRCTRCGRHLRWMAKPDADKYRRPAAHKTLVKKFSRGYCEMCLIREENLPRGECFEAHHVHEFQDGGVASRENIWILCTACHKLVNWRRTYVGHLVQSVADALTRWKRDWF